MYQSFKLLVVFLLITFICGCATTSINPNDNLPLKKGEGIIFGLVEHEMFDTDNTRLSTENHPKFNYSINFSKKDSGFIEKNFNPTKIFAFTNSERIAGDTLTKNNLFVQSLPEGEYSIESVGFYSGQVNWFTLMENASFEVIANKATYIGNIVMTFTPNKGFFGETQYLQSTKVVIRNKATETVAMYKKEYPELKYEIVNTNPAVEILSAEKYYQPIPEDSNSNGLFNISKDVINTNKITKVIATDYLYEDNGKLKKRNREHIFTYDDKGNLTSSSGYVDQSGNQSKKFIFDENNDLLEEHLFQGLDITGNPEVKVVYKNSKNKRTEKRSYNSKGVLLGRSTFDYDKHGNNTRVDNYDSENKLLYSVTKKYDQFNNLKEKIKSNLKIVYSYKGNVIEMTVILPNGGTHSLFEYTFNNNGTIKSYTRTSGDEEYFDKYVYSYYDNGLPMSKVHSRKEFFTQDPYELTKYEYIKQISK